MQWWHFGMTECHDRMSYLAVSQTHGSSEHGRMRLQAFFFNAIHNSISRHAFIHNYKEVVTWSRQRRQSVTTSSGPTEAEACWPKIKWLLWPNRQNSMEPWDPSITSGCNQQSTILIPVKWLIQNAWQCCRLIWPLVNPSRQLHELWSKQKMMSSTDATVSRACLSKNILMCPTACDYVTAVLTILQRIIGIAQDNELINAISHAGLKRHI